jgi:beta-phosphoglucomutase-like phosphatase (HAD superfamily)
MELVKKILYIDMDGVLVNFQSGIDKLTKEELEKYAGQEKNAPHIFSKMDPIEGAIDAYVQLAQKYNTYIYLRLLGIMKLLSEIKLVGLKSILEMRFIKG